MRYLFLIFLLVSCNATTKISFADNPVIAHRGAWKAKNLPENSIAALKHAIELGCTGSEFDVRMTSDQVLIVTHDPDYNGLIIEENTYTTLARYKLSNGETLPTLRNYILASMEKNSGTGLVCELKPSKTEGRNELMATLTVDLVKELKAEKYISYYISFHYDILKKIMELDPKAKTQYLDGSKSPEILSKDNISGLDYAVHKLKKNPEWIQKAKDKNLKLNAWTANSVEDLDWLIANDFDYITTNEPELLFERLKVSPTKKGWKLVWSDVFNYTGKPDPTKWAYDYGFIANQEKQ